MKNKQKQLKIKGKKQSDALDSLKPSGKQLPSLRDFISKERLNSEIVNEKERIREEERKFERIKMVYKGSNETYDFRKFKTVLVFGNEIRNNIINMSMASRTKPHNLETKKVKEDLLCKNRNGI